jgi:diacylglycerol kinase (ATP)
MRAAAIFGLGCSPKNLRPFQSDNQAQVEWRIGMPAAAGEADVVLLFGGDGTIHRHLSQLVKLGLPVLVVPAGSGNDFARSLGLNHVRDSLKVWRRFLAGSSAGEHNDVRAIDLGVIKPTGVAHEDNAQLAPTRYFCCVAGVGIDGEVSRRANLLPRWLRGHGGYVLSLAPTILSFAAIPMKIETSEATDDSPVAESDPSWLVRSDQPTVVAVFANTPVYGGGMNIAPRARMDDGLLDVCLVTDIDKAKLFCLFPTVYFGRHLTLPEVEYFQTIRVRVETEHPIDVYADGEYVCRTPVEVGVHRGALRVLAPCR